MLAVTIAAATLLAATAAGDIVDPRPRSHVVDVTGTLSAGDIVAIDAQAARAAGGGELMVVVVPTTDGINPRQWTTTLFNRLGLDDKSRDRGVMLMAAVGDRKSEIVVGDGFPGGVTSTTDSIMSGVVVARFKASNPRGAMVEGARAIVDRVLLTSAPASEATARAPDDGASASPARRPATEELAAAADAVVRGVPDPRDRGGVIDGARLFSKVELRELRAVREAPGGAEIAVVTASAIGELSTSLFARGLFLRLQDAHPSPRAVLLVVIAPSAKSKRGDAPPVAEVVLGDAYPPAFALSTATGVSAAWLVRAANQSGRLGAATLEAMRSLASLDGELARWQAEQARLEEEARRARMAVAASRSQQAARALAEGGTRKVRRPPAIPGGLWGLGAMALGLFASGLGVREAVRRWPRKCKKCNVRMERLGEEIDDQHLSEGEQAEERLGSVDYDIWSCPQCGDVLKRRWGALMSGFSTCGSCSFRTLSSTRTTVKAATQHSTGLAEVTERCGHCSHARRYTRVIPRKPPPSSRSSSSRSSSSRSSSGGSRGGSSGRGSSGSW